MTYACIDKTFDVVLHRGDSERLFNERRIKAARMVCNPTKLVYLSWTGEVVSFAMDMNQWKLFHKTVHQERYRFNGLQIVSQRATCSVSHKQVFCRSCANPQWRNGCEDITFHNYLMPLPNISQTNMDMMKIVFSDLQAKIHPCDPKEWIARLPQLTVRTTISEA